MATPEDNAVKIETVKGDLKALEQKVEGSLKQQAENGRRIDENVSEIKTSIKDFTDKQSDYTKRLFNKSDDQGKEITRIGGRQDALEEISDQRNENIHQTFGQMKETIQQTIKAAFAEGQVALVQSQLNSGKDSVATWKWIVGIIITILIASGWFL